MEMTMMDYFHSLWANRGLLVPVLMVWEIIYILGLAVYQKVSCQLNTVSFHSSRFPLIVVEHKEQKTHK
jgi:hypothetical protein